MANLWTIPYALHGKTAFILGGGPSLNLVDLSIFVSGKYCVIGCNDAYLLGSWLSFCIFGDLAWFYAHSENLKASGIPTVTIRKELCNNPAVYVTKMIPFGWSCNPSVMAWNGNTGALAVNFAYLLGAGRVVLLGFDMQMKDKESNWHPPFGKASETAYPRFLRCWRCMWEAMQYQIPPDSPFTVVNATVGSRLGLFPMVSLENELKKEYT